MTYHPSTNTYTCDTCKKSDLPVGMILRPTAKLHKCISCRGEALPQAPKQPRPQDDPLRAAADRGAPVADVYYRRMSQAEYEAITANSRINLAAALQYVDTRNYRLWFSTSKAKCDAFGNENNDTSGFVVRLVFKPDFSNQVRKLLQPHQMRGVQNTPKFVAYHREGFVQLGNVTTTDQMELLLNANRHHNVGFTQEHTTLLQKNIQRVETV